ncbi:hypothetical protein Pcinc_010808 [Petrolisthes cinctipes]|uniref:Uncharacterized protein n=1 Tax=Petrolisthes cinctipes TaxID=88211 RepID=A0AAE1KX21_PETCI|nr:hypothetical protein Pcinc_010808 [Petrolisthes cinctipes]
MLVVYAVVDLDYCCREQPVESDCETPLMYALTCTLEDEIGKIRGYKRTRKVNVVVVGGVDKKDALRVSVILERTLSTLNIMASDNKTYTKYVLMNKNRRGKAIRPKQGQKMATDEPPEDVAGLRRSKTAGLQVVGARSVRGAGGLRALVGRGQGEPRGDQRGQHHSRFSVRPAPRQKGLLRIRRERQEKDVHVQRCSLRGVYRTTHTRGLRSVHLRHGEEDLRLPIRDHGSVRASIVARLFGGRDRGRGDPGNKTQVEPVYNLQEDAFNAREKTQVQHDCRYI